METHLGRLSAGEQETHEIFLTLTRLGSSVFMCIELHELHIILLQNMIPQWNNESGLLLDLLQEAKFIRAPSLILSLPVVA